MAGIGLRGAAEINSMGNGGMAGGEISLHTPAGWHFTIWGASVAVIIFLLWAL